MWTCPYKNCKPRTKCCETLDDLCEHILSVKSDFYIQGHTIPPSSSKKAYVEKLTCEYCGKIIISRDWSETQKHLQGIEYKDGLPKLKEIPRLKESLKRKILFHTRICDGFRNWFDIAQIKQSIVRIEETQNEILCLLRGVLYAPPHGLEYQKSLDDFEQRIEQNQDKGG